MRSVMEKMSDREYRLVKAKKDKFMEIQRTIAESKDTIERTTKEMKEAEEQLPLSRQPLEKLDNEFEALKLQITQKWLERCHKFLEKKTNDTAINILESLIGIM
mgnify:CR=1 FL=1